jgi:hypothetical protein
MSFAALTTAFQNRDIADIEVPTAEPFVCASFKTSRSPLAMMDSPDSQVESSHFAALTGLDAASLTLLAELCLRIRQPCLDPGVDELIGAPVT